jgi:phenylalanyl-tRNA synthetase beta chain
MKISLNLLKTLIDCDWTFVEIAERLTMSGTEVEGIELRGQEISGVVSAEVKSVVNIEGSGKLTTCAVFTGAGEVQVVCGAPNVAAGQIVLFAPAGARLPGGAVIEKAHIHGVDSAGMILSGAELALTPEAETIAVLPPEIKPGLPLDKIVEYRDVIFELEITPNRPDCLSHIGIARELQALGGGRVRFPDIDPPETSDPVYKAVSIEIADPPGCPRYTGRVARYVRVAPSPLWLKTKLHYLGIRPINNIVDITNFVMLELGQPLHAFDFARFSNPEIIVRRARNGEKFITLDNVERSLTDQHLLITDGSEAVAIAGIMGGLLSEVTELTRDVLLESAYFDAVTVRRGSRSLGLSSESSRRFERGADPQMAPIANNRACKLIADLTGGQILTGIVDCHPRAFAPVTIELRPARVEWLLGARINDEQIGRILNGLDIEFKKNSNFVVRQPSFRPDLTREVDLIEEIARLYGFDKIPATFQPGGELTTPESKTWRILAKVRAYLAGAGLIEVFPLTLGDGRLASRLGLDGSAVRIMNPISEELAVARPDLILTLLPVIRRNLGFRETDLALFETGDVYVPNGPGQLPSQKMRLGIALCGMEFPDFWGAKWRRRDIFSLKGVLEDLADHLQLGRVEIRPASHFVFEKGYSFEVIIGNRIVGRMGRLSREAAQAADIKEDVYLAELDFEPLVESAPEVKITKELARFPSADRDIAIVVDENLPAGEIESAIGTAGSNLIESIRVFDLYQGKNIPTGKKSLAFGMKFRLPDRTLTDDEVNQALAKIITALQDRFKAELRR